MKAVNIVLSIWVEAEDSEIVDIDNLEVTESVYQKFDDILQTTTIKPIVHSIEER